MFKEKIKKKQEERIIDIMASLDKLPFKICYYTEVIVKAGLIEPTDIELPCFDKFLRRVEKCPDKVVLQKVISYNVNQILWNEWKDSRGLIIAYRFTYFRNAIVHGFAKQGMDQDFIDSLYDNYEEEN